ncbi:MAG TPA: YlxR family protein [Candidatus Dormibacteraeota bacterium]
MSAGRTEPLRTCVGCRQVKAQRELNRIGVADSQVVINPRRVSGRSAYLCSDEACWSTAEKRRAVDRALGVHLAPEDWARLRAGILS